MRTRTWLALTLLAVSLGCASRPRDALLGTWRSDRAGTLAAMNDARITPEVRALLSDILGGLVVEYRADTYCATFEGETTCDSYEVVDEGPGWVDVRVYSDLEQRPMTRRMWIEGDRMWLHVAGTKLEFDEYFVRLPD